MALTKITIAEKNNQPPSQTKKPANSLLEVMKSTLASGEDTMKKYLNILLFVIIVFSFNSPCLANPLSNFISLFQSDLVINVLYKNHKNLIQNSEVYLAEDPKGQKILIGKVKKISLTEAQMSEVEIIVDKKHKEEIYETTTFVLMSGLFSQNSIAYIVAISPKEPSNKTHLKSGSSVTGVTFLEYKIATAGEELKKMMNSIKQQNNELLNQLEQYIDTFNTEDFQRKMDDLINKLSEFSAEQKEVFKNEVLPSLRKTFNSMMEKLEEQNNLEESKDLEKQLNEIEDIIDV